MRTLLNVPYPQNNAAKANGAKWDARIKTWYTDDTKNFPSLSRWIQPHSIICENLYILKMTQKCWSCGHNTEVVLFATDKSYSVDEDYALNTNIQILTYVKKMPDALAKCMAKHQYTVSFSNAIKESYYINHCNKCNRLQGDNYLHEIPERAFYKKLFYPNSTPVHYQKIKNYFCIPLLATLPYYDEISGSLELALAHMETGVENRASLNVTQKKINALFQNSIKDPDLDIPELL